jgi:hypothetical protein
VEKGQQPGKYRQWSVQIIRRPTQKERRPRYEVHEDILNLEGSLDRMEATSLEANPEATEAALKRQELRKRLVVGRRRWAKKGTQENFGSQQRLYAAWKRQIRRAVPALWKGIVLKRPGWKKSVRRT